MFDIQNPKSVDLCHFSNTTKAEKFTMTGFTKKSISQLLLNQSVCSKDHFAQQKLPIDKHSSAYLGMATVHSVTAKKCH